MFDKFADKLKGGNTARQERDYLSSELKTYRDMAVELEVDNQMQSFELDLAGFNRNILTSNDKFQLSAAFLAVARGRAVLMNSIYDKLTSEDDDVRTQNFDIEAVSRFLHEGYKSAQEGVEVADHISVETGFKADQRNITGFENYLRDIHWPGVEVHSSLFMEGAKKAVEDMNATVYVQYRTIMHSNNVPNDFKLKLKGKLEPVLGRVGSNIKAIDRIVEGSGGSINSTAVMAGIYDDIKEAFELLEQGSVWLTMPRLHDPYFNLRRPLNENKPFERKFDAGILGRPTLPAVVKPAPEVLPQRPFDPSALNKPKPTQSDVAVDPPIPARPFDPSVLNRKATADSNASQAAPPPRSEKLFDPTILSRPNNAPAAQRPFDPSILVRRSDGEPARPFNPDVLKRD